SVAVSSLLHSKELEETEIASSEIMDAGHNYQVRTLTAVAQAAIEVLSCRSSVKNVLGNIFASKLKENLAGWREEKHICVLLFKINEFSVFCILSSEVGGNIPEMRGWLPGGGGTDSLPLCRITDLAKELVMTGRRMLGTETQLISLFSIPVSPNEEGGMAYYRGLALCQSVLP
uniref:Uncharacterized protein n=1 Tax=Sus scrofa TaxID=9823 RepID=A0A8D0NY00_PIG